MIKGKRRLSILLGIAAIAAAVSVAVVSFRPDAPAVTFVALTGERIPMAELRGKVVLVEFWATDCATCVKEMPQLVGTYEKYRAQGFEAIAVAMKYDPPNYVIAYTRRSRLPFTVALDPTGDLAKAFGNVNATPTTFLIDKRGKIAARMLGARDFARLHAVIEEKLRESA